MTLDQSIAYLSNPQHLLNLAQVALSGASLGKIDLCLLSFPSRSKALNEEMLRETLRFLQPALGDVQVRWIRPRPGFASLRLYREARKVRRLHPQVLVLGLPIHDLWLGVFDDQSHVQLLLLEDGAASVVEREPVELIDFLARRIGWIPKRVLRNFKKQHMELDRSAKMYSAHIAGHKSITVVHHQYEELKKFIAESKNDFNIDFPAGVLIDSNYSAIGEASHLALVKEAKNKIGFDAYIPHRNTPKEFLIRLEKEVGLRVIRPWLPIEVVLDSWTKAGNHIYFLPGSSILNAHCFVSTAQLSRIKLLGCSHWMECRLNSQIPGIAYEIKATKIIEAKVAESDLIEIIEIS